MLIVTWNVNSIKIRIQHVIDFLKLHNPDIVLLQELKCMTEAFPYLEIESLGYNVAVLGQKTYNGVAILSKYPIDEVIKNLPNYDNDNARYIEAVISLPNQAIRVASVYVPNGQDLDSDKFVYKKEFLDRLCIHLKEIIKYDEKVVIGGDYNIAPENIDVYDHQKLANSVCFNSQEQAKYQALINLGYYDAYRLIHPSKIQFTWWDYRGNDYAQDNGYRIDHLLLSSKAADIIKDAGVFKEERAKEKPSDHAPVFVKL